MTSLATQPDSILCLQCGEDYETIRTSQRSRSPIYCAIVAWDGEVEADWSRHRFRPWTDDQLDRWGVAREHYGEYRRMYTAYDIRPEHRKSDYFWRS